MIVTLIAFVVTVGAFALRIGVSPVYPGLVIAGMIGNTIDRLRFGAARDFIRTPLAIVNVADLAVVFGIVLIAMALLLRVRRLAV
jgi:lipoprotein signal peptidase